MSSHLIGLYKVIQVNYWTKYLVHGDLDKWLLLLLLDYKERKKSFVETLPNVCLWTQKTRIIYQILTAVWRKSPILHACNFQNNLLLACIFCMALKIRSIKNKDGSFSLLSSKMSLPTNISYLKRRMGRPTLQTAWISRLRHHNEGAIFSQGAGPWPSQWKMDSIKACVWCGQYTSLKSNRFLEHLMGLGQTLPINEVGGATSKKPHL